jgi:cell division protein ZapA (FtsZ GTPase activity inhibitor)
MDKSSVQIKLLGTSFTIQVDEDPQYIQQLVAFLERKSREIEESGSVKDPLRISILTGLLVADELFKERERSTSSHPPSTDKHDEELSRLTEQIIRRLDSTLPDTT